MNRLWVFGDSFSAGNGCYPEEVYPPKYKQTENDLIWPEILAKELKMELNNRAMGLNSNDKIIDSIIDNYYSILEGDIVIIGKTFPSRFDIPTKKRTKLMTVSPVNMDPTTLAYFNAGYNEQDLESIWQMVDLMDDPLLTSRQDFRFNFLKSLLIQPKQVKKCIIWSVEDLWQNFETIVDATEEEIIDYHWSYRGHKDFAKYITEQMELKQVEVKPSRKLI